MAHISSLKKSADDLLQQLQKTYNVAINTGLAGSFDSRKEDVYENFVKKWGVRFFTGLGAIAIIALFILYFSFKNSNLDFDRLMFFRLSLLSPVVVYTTYAAIQYGRERRLLEKYAFKTAVAASLESYINILFDKFDRKKHDETILNFVITTMKSIYGEPHEEIIKRKYGFFLGNKLAHIKSDLEEEVAKKVKEELELKEKEI